MVSSSAETPRSCEPTIAPIAQPELDRMSTAGRFDQTSRNFGVTPTTHSMATQLFLIRHGETQWALTGQHTGRTNLPLTEAGERRAAGLRGLLSGVPFARVLASPLLRARQTCELAGLGAVATIEPDLVEWNYGDYEGRTSADIHRERPGWNVFRDGSPGGESVEQVAQRADRVLAHVRLIEGTVAMFSHGQFLRALAMRWVGLPVPEGRHFSLDTGAISILGYEHANRETPAVVLWNAADNALFALTPAAGGRS
jgi:broad specificity phosphatase PhoE